MGLLLSTGHSCYRARRTRERKCRSVCGWIVDTSLSALNLAIVQGEKDIPGLTDTTVPHQLGPKRAIRKLFNLSKDDVCQNVIKEPLNKEGKEPRTKAPNIQCLVTSYVLRHKCRCIALKKQHIKKNKEEAAEYVKPLAKTVQEAKEKCQEWIAKRCRLSLLRASTSKS